MAQEPHFTVFIRCPFPRGDFVDPPPVKWDSAKDQALWDILSRTSKGHVLSQCVKENGHRHKVKVARWRTLLRHVVSVRSHPSVLDVAHTREGARMSRNSSTNTVHQIQRASPKLSQQPSFESSTAGTPFARAREASQRLSDVTPKDRPPSGETGANRSSKVESSSSSSSESEIAPALSRSRAYQRRPRHSSSKAPLGPLSDADEDDPDSPPFLPFSDPKATKQSPPADPSATLRMAKRALPEKAMPAPLLNSSSSSTQSQPPRTSRPPQQQPGSKNPISPPRIPNEPASALSPRQRKVVKDGSDGTPSMGSSFSDLDDASVTQSALEEALAHEMNQQGGVASRMSTISQALRSRYL
ncbi:MAG: hypothetical protein LQ348_006609 [Seirophora lacunosa]|nr:MAG: hypothetical protein LQ348_006609 [Seirophora lacunosa]